jgi:hypothetical protein
LHKQGPENSRWECVARSARGRQYSANIQNIIASE